jgi:K+-sensing histidine kinase KdpD
VAVLAGVLGPPALCAVLVPFRQSFANTDAALVLVAGIVAVASLGNRLGGWLAAISAGIWFDFFLTKPYEHFSITSRTDVETTLLLFVVGVGVTEIAVWGRRQHARPVSRRPTSPDCMPPRRRSRRVDRRPRWRTAWASC